MGSRMGFPKGLYFIFVHRHQEEALAFRRQQEASSSLAIEQSQEGSQLGSQIRNGWTDSPKCNKPKF